MADYSRFKASSYYSVDILESILLADLRNFEVEMENLLNLLSTAAPTIKAGKVPKTTLAREKNCRSTVKVCRASLGVGWSIKRMIPR